MRTYASFRVKRKRKSELQMFLLISGGKMASPPHGYKGARNVSANNSETVGHKDRRPGQIVYILVFYNISFSWLLPLNDFQFICLLRDCWRLSNTVICICGLTCHVSRRLFWAIEMFTKGQNHRTLFREAECKRILLQFALGYLKLISLRGPQRRGAWRNGCFFCQQGKVSRWIGFNISKQNSALKIFSLHFLGFCLTKMLNFEIWVQVMSLFQRSDYNLIIIICKSVWSVHDQSEPRTHVLS